MDNSENETPELNTRMKRLLPVRVEPAPGKSPGRKPGITPSVLLALRDAFLLGCDDQEACLMAGIATSTLYSHQQGNKSFLEWKESLKRTPFLKARKTIVEHIERDPEFALKYMERKKKTEFSPRAQIVVDDQRNTLDEDIKGKIGESLFEHVMKLQAKNNNANPDTSSEPIPRSN